ncbi:MAG: hypothetical protein ACM3X5_04665 [Bacillota bacterium]
MKRLLILIASLWVPWAGAAYKCVDERGVTLFGYPPPPGCARVMMYEVTPSGKVLRQIEPTPTPEQLKARQAEIEKKKEADKVAAEQKRKDMALLATFSAEKEFDVARDRNIEPIKSRIAGAQERIKAIDKRTKELEDEMEFYKSGKKAAKNGKQPQVPFNMTSEYKRIGEEKVTLIQAISDNEKEIERLSKQFEEDKQRWIALKTGGKAPPVDTKPAVRKN